MIFQSHPSGYTSRLILNACTPEHTIRMVCRLPGNASRSFSRLIGPGRPRKKRAPAVAQSDAAAAVRLQPLTPYPSFTTQA